VSLLEVRGLSVSYGGIKAVRGIDLEVCEGELVCLIGANGAGKTTTLKALAGLLPSRGSVVYQGKNILNFPSHELVKQGIALVPEGRGIFGRLTVAENLEMGAYSRHDRAEIKSDLQTT
jgi:branched-chain amino acid transport system ATP-binding protein